MSEIVKRIYLEIIKPSPQCCSCDLSNIRGFITHGNGCWGRTNIDIEIAEFYKRYVVKYEK